MTIANSIVLADNAFGTLGAGLTVSGTSLTFTTGHGARFPTVVAGQVLSCCLLNSSNIIEEIDITAHAAGSDSATITRGANSTTAKIWNSGDIIQSRWSSDVARRMNQEALPETVIGTVDAGATYTGTPNPALLGYVSGVIYPLLTSTTNSVADPKIALSGLVQITVKLDGTVALVAGQMPAHGLYQFDGTNFILLNPVFLNPQFKIGTFTRDTSLATGTQSITGVGFKPRLVFFLFGSSSGGNSGSVGFDNVTNAGSLSNANSVTAGTWAVNASSSIIDTVGVGVTYTGNIQSMDSDGFTISWVKTGAPSGTLTGVYCALR